MRVVPFPVLGSASSGTVIVRVLHRIWTLCAWSHFRYWALPVLVRSLLGSHIRTGLYVRGPISGTGLCHFWHSPSLGPVPEVDFTCVVPFPVLGSASSGMVIVRVPYQNWTLCAWSHFRDWAMPFLVRSFTGPHTGSGLYAHGPISSTGL
jgi:hypothetical protein